MSKAASRALETHPFVAESDILEKLAARALLDDADSSRVARIARQLVTAVRRGRKQEGGIEEFMQEYELSSKEGVVLMCLAEALLRIPDAQTADDLIADKIGGAAWERHLGNSDSLFVNASTWGLMLTGHLLEADKDTAGDPKGFLTKLVARAGEPVIRQAMRHAMRIMGKQFVLGRTICEAIKTAAPLMAQGYRFSFDMLGEAAHTQGDAARYFDAYQRALHEIAEHSQSTHSNGVFERPSISIKLSAIHPRYEEMKFSRVMSEMVPKLLQLAREAKQHNLGLTIDAEEMDRLDLSLDVFKALATAPQLAGWNGLGLAVQAYSRRALPVLEFLEKLARDTGRKLPVRLVKGAYWDSEIKWAQEAGLPSFPVFTRKVSTDVSYLACARFLLENRSSFYPQFASHNAQTIASVFVMAGDKKGYECQRLHGMGQALYDEVIARDGLQLPTRIYAPVGSHEDLLAYLVRRLLENGANTSFVNRLSDDALPIEDIIEDPVQKLSLIEEKPHPAIRAPQDLFAPRQNSAGIALWHHPTREDLLVEVEKVGNSPVSTQPLLAVGNQSKTAPKRVLCPYDNSQVVGTVVETEPQLLDRAVEQAVRAQKSWNDLGGQRRGKILRKAAQLYEANRAVLVSLLIREAGKTLENAIGDLREAVDFLRYYADEADRLFSHKQLMPGPTGERNELSLNGRGVFATIAPWNFPLAIFTGQTSAALAAGNAVIAKPAEQTPLVAYQAVTLLHEAGVPTAVLQFAPGRGSVIGAHLTKNTHINGVAFTGSTETAALINKTLAGRAGPLATLIAETGGMNAMLADSSALPEQIVSDLVRSAFDSAGQRCSAARILFIQSDIAKKVKTMLCGAIEELQVGNPMHFSTDIGPVIDQDAKDVLEAHKKRMASAAKTLIDLALPKECEKGTFVSPCAYELEDLSLLKREVFGPVLHVVEYEQRNLEKVCDAINATGYGLTFGLHSRIETTTQKIVNRIRAGNIYVNRNQIGAVVGAQPFGGVGLSGTGPKAGGPHYLVQFASEKVVSTDTTASGGNAALLSLESGGEN